MGRSKNLSTMKGRYGKRIDAILAVLFGSEELKNVSDAVIYEIAKRIMDKLEKESL